MTITLGAGPATATIDADRGGRLASLVIHGRERLVVRPPASAALPAIGWGSFPMVPWVGRMRAGRLEWDGAVVDLPRNLGRHAIHGTTFDRPWSIEGFDDRRIELRCRIGDGDGWPFGATVSQAIELAEDAIRFEIAVEADGPMPVAVGWHPWFARRGDEPITLTVPATHVLETTADLIPTGALVPVAGKTDLRGTVVVGDRALDHAYVGVRGASRLAWPDLELTIAAEPLGSVVVHSTRTGVCVEPQTAWPDAIRLAARGIETGLVALDAGATFRATTNWTWRILDAAG